MPKKTKPEFKIDWDVFERACSVHATLPECAALLGCSEDTVERGVKKKYGKRFAEVFREKSAAGNVSLRRAMWNKALQGQDSKMMIWLAKNHLGMSDKNEQVIKTNSPAEVKIVWETAPGDQERFLDKKSEDENGSSSN